jgi:AAA15 family ATPase/GTPase
MLLRFKFSNFRSFRDEQEFSFVANSIEDPVVDLITSSAVSDQVLPIAAIYGANASGKTNVLKALSFLCSAVRWSHSRWEPSATIDREPFVGQESVPSEFTVDFAIRDIRYEYGFSLNDRIILREWLYAYPKAGKKQVWFRRDEERQFSFGTKMPGENKTIAGLARENSLFLSAAAQNNHALLLPIYNWFGSLDFVIGNRAVLAQHTAELCTDETYRNRISELIVVADLGIESLVPSTVEMSETIMKVLEYMKSTLKLKSELDDKQHRVLLKHRIGTNSVLFENSRESEGTLAYLSLLGPVVRSLSQGSVLCLDELDSSLHPLLAMKIMSIFGHRTTNPLGAQLIATTHDTNLLSRGILRRDQIWFTEKRSEGDSSLYPLTDFRPRRHENLERGYLQGRYGAIPFFQGDLSECMGGSDGEP